MQLRLLILAALPAIALAQNPNTAVFPGGVATDSNLLVATDNARTTLAAAIGPTATTVTLSSFVNFVTPMVITIDNEQLLCLTHNSAAYSCSRGWAGSSAKAHAFLAIVHGNVTAYPLNQLAAEVKAIEAHVPAQTNGQLLAPIAGVGASFTGAQTIAPSKLVGLLSSLASIKAGNTTTATVAAFGDSWTAGQTWLNPLRSRWQLGLGNSGPGYVSFDSFDAGIALGANKTVTGTWTNFTSTICPNTSATSSTDTATPGQVQVWGWNGDTAQIFYVGGAGTFRYQMDATGWVNVNTAAQTGLQTVTLSGLSSPGQHSLYVQDSVAGAAVTLCGVDLRVTSVSGVRAETMARSGQTAQFWATMDQPSLSAALSAINPGLLFIMLGVNDWQTGRTAAQFQTDLTTVLGKLQSAAPYASPVILTQTDSGYASPAGFAPFVTAMQTVALANNVPFIDLWDTVGPYQVNGVNDPHSLYNGAQHPNSTGGQLIAEIVSEYIPQLLETPGLRTALASIAGINSTPTGLAAYGGVEINDKSIKGVSNVTIREGANQSNNPEFVVTNSNDSLLCLLQHANGTAYYLQCSQDFHIGTSTNTPVILRTNGVDRLTIDGSGNVSTPNGTWTAAGTGGHAITMSPGANPNFTVSDGSMTVALQVATGAFGYVGTSSADPFHIRSNGADRITFDTAGNQTGAHIQNLGAADMAGFKFLVDGIATIASATTIAPATRVTHITGTTPIATITSPVFQSGTSGFGGCIDLIPDGAFTTTTAGNIAIVSTAVVNKKLSMCYDNGTSKWYPSY